jgi:rhodanese-related sulfurtransferase
MLPFLPYYFFLDIIIHLIQEKRLKKIILTLLLFVVSLFAEVKSTYITQQFLDSKIPIVDVRTPGEWKATGVLKGAIPIMFFDQNGKAHVNSFLTTLNKKVDTSKPFAIICHTGNRTSMIAPWLSDKLHYNVVNLLGGMEYAVKGAKLKTLPYKK